MNELKSLSYLKWLTISLSLNTTFSVVRGDASLERGKEIFKQCAACHNLTQEGNGVGPSLSKLFGRKAGADSGFRYSPALKNSGLVWTAKTLDLFVADPQKAVPGNRMPFEGVPDSHDRAELIKYLRQATKPR